MEDITFPIILDTNHPEFFWRLEQCYENNQKLAKINQSDRAKFFKFWQKLPAITAIIWHMLRIYFVKPIDAELTRETVK